MGQPIAITNNKELPLGTLGGGVWTVRLHGSFSLCSPEGESVRFQNGMVDALFAILSQHREFGILRDDLAAILWPGKAHPNQKSSLRQALALCRKVIGAEAIEASRSHCRFADRFELEVLPGSGVFMPGHEGDYFDDVRRDDLLSENSSKESGVLRAWLQILEWNAAHDPGTFFNLLRIAPHQAEGLPFRDLERLLVQASTESKDAWAEYWWGTVLDDLEDCRQHLKTALRLGLETRDDDLLSKICLELGRACSRMGRLKGAQSVSALADEIADRSGVPAHRVNALRLKGTLNFHWGDPKRGSDLFEKAIQIAGSPMEQHHLTASLALFQAGYGFETEAQASLDRISADAASLGHMKLASLVQLARQILLARSSDPESGYRQVIAAVQSAPVSEQISSYTEELLSFLCDRKGATGLATGNRTKSLHSRAKTKDVATNWVRTLGGQPITGPALT